MRRVAIGTVMVAAMACASCSKTADAPVAPLKKVESPASGLPVAAPKPGEAPVKAAGEAPGDAVHQGAMGSPTAVPDDDVHKAAKAGMMGAGGMGDMGGMGGQNGLPGHGMVQDAGQADGGDPALRLNGLGSKAELDKALKDIEGDDAKKKFDAAFRLTFAADKSKRDIDKAKASFEEILKAQPAAAPCYRGLAYVALSRGFDVDGAVAAYKKALEVKPDYAEVHYAMAFLFAGSDLDKGRDHLKRALELGMPDEQGLKKVYNLP